MKIFYAVIIALLFCSGVCGQTNVYHPFPEDTATWVVSSESQYCNWVTNLNQNYCGSTIYLMSGDTIINTVSYNKIYSKCVKFYYVQYPPNTIIGCQGCSGNYSYSFAIRQDSASKKVYCIDNTMASDTLLYNFNLIVGDTLPLTFGNNLPSSTIISSIDSIMINSSYHKCFRFNNNLHRLIEGVGWDCDLRNVFFIAEGSSDLDCFDYNDINIGSGLCGILITSNSEIEKNNSENKFSISPNPFTTQTTVSVSGLQFPVSGYSLQLYDVFGRLLLNRRLETENYKLERNDLPSGIYFLRLLHDNKPLAAEKLVITD